MAFILVARSFMADILPVRSDLTVHAKGAVGDSE
jgi:hypothetical protein